MLLADPEGRRTVQPRESVNLPMRRNYLAKHRSAMVAMPAKRPSFFN